MKGSLGLAAVLLIASSFSASSGTFTARPNWLVYTAAPGQPRNSLVLRQNGPSIELVNAATGALLSSRPLRK